MNRIKIYAAFIVSLSVHFILLFFSRIPAVDPDENNSDRDFELVNAVVLAQPVSEEDAVVNEPDINEAVEAAPDRKPAIEPEEATVKTENSQEPVISDEDSLKGSEGPVAENREEQVFIPFYRVDSRPEFLHKENVIYPEIAKNMNAEGTVILEVDLDENGEIVNIRIIKKAGFGFDEAAVEMIKASDFTPAFSNGKPVAVCMQFTVQFKLE